MNMQSVIILFILILLLIPALKNTVLHFKGEGSCCGGPKEKRVKKKIKGKKIKELTIQIDGMHCENCKNRIEKHLDAMDGVVAKVNLGRKNAVVSLYKEVSTESIMEVIEKLDFTVLKVSEKVF